MFVEQQLLGAQNDFDCLITTTKYALKNDCRNLIDSTTNQQTRKSRKNIRKCENDDTQSNREKKQNYFYYFCMCIMCGIIIIIQQSEIDSDIDDDIDNDYNDKYSQRIKYLSIIINFFDTTYYFH